MRSWTITLIIAMTMILPLIQLENADSARSIFAPKTIIVAQDGTGDHTTIQDGVDAASDGDTVRVYDGIYYESVSITRSIEIIGNGTTKSILDGKGTLDHQHLFHVWANSVNITGFHFRKGSPHHEFAGVGIYSSDVHVYKNLFTANTNGIYIAAGPKIVISNNTFDVNYRGIRSDMGCDKNTIIHNKFTNNTSVGILYLGASNVTVTGNSFIDNAYHMGLFRSNYYDIGHNLFQNADPGRSGLVIGTAMFNKVHNNTFKENDVAIGMSTKGDNNEIVDNIITGNIEGIKTHSDVFNNHVHRNSFINNSLLAINFSASSIPLNATLNWWGNYTGPYDPVNNPSGTGDNVSINVTYSPWLLGEMINHDPVLEPLQDVFTNEDEIVNIPISAFDIDGQEVEIEVISDADFLNFDVDTGNITGIPDNEDVGEYIVTIKANDGWGGTDSGEFTITVNNTPPRILTRSVPDAIEDELYQFMVIFEEEPNSNYTIRSDAVWLTIDDRNLTGRPGNDDTGIYFLEIEYDDNNGGIDYLNLTLNVTPVDDPPVIINSLQNIDMLEDNTYILDLSEWVLDPDDDLTNYSFKGNSNLTVLFTDMTAVINPAPNWNGYDVCRFSVKGGEVEIFQMIMIEVMPVNDAPENASITLSSDNIMEGEHIFLNATAEDPDLIYGDRLNYTWHSNISGDLGEGISIQASLETGHHLIILNVSDSEGEFILVEHAIHVAVKVIVDDNDTIPVNDTDDNTTVPDDDTDDDNSTVPDDDTDDTVDDDDSIDDPVDGDTNEDKDEDKEFPILLIPGAILIILLLVVVIYMVRSSREEEMDWGEE